MSTKQPPARKGSKSYHHGDLREALIKTAMEMVEQQGAETVTFSALAKKLGVSQAAPYRHFSDRDALLTILATMGFLSFTEGFRKAIKTPSDNSQLNLLAHAHLKFGTERSGIYRLMFESHYLHEAVIGSALQQAVDENFNLLLDTLGMTSEVNTRDRIALKLAVAVHGIVMFAEHGFLPKIREISLTQLVDELVQDAETAFAVIA
ncbi:MAG: TetR/AcrR family transcriptional regulator [Parvibaculaceae bacterium]|nr:TetR/AcrR family transcriptional regulator [Parvibaculaceae bacterium]